MGRHTGPVEKLSRREGVELELKGERLLRGKSGLERRGPNPPGQHGGARRRRESTYALQLREKQRMKRFYGVREKQFRRYVDAASRRKDVRMGEALLVSLELRLDNVIFRMGYAVTRAQARQFVVHGHVLVDGVRCDRPSRAVKPGSVVAIEPGSPIVEVATAAAELVGQTPGWMLVDHDELTGTVERLPNRREIQVPVTEQLIVEFYSRV
jgi:small subunit ribosomal protein S4